MLKDTDYGRRTTLADQSLIPYCPVCGAPMAVNIRCDATFVEDDAWHLAERRYRRWRDAALDTRRISAIARRRPPPHPAPPNTPTPHRTARPENPSLTRRITLFISL